MKFEKSDREPAEDRRSPLDRRATNKPVFGKRRLDQEPRLDPNRPSSTRLNPSDRG